MERYVFPGPRPFLDQAQEELGTQVHDLAVFRLAPFKTLSSVIGQAVAAPEGLPILEHCQEHLNVLKVAVRTSELMLERARSALEPAAAPPRPAAAARPAAPAAGRRG